MEKLQKAYEAIEMLESLNIPVSKEQMQAIAQMEKAYLIEEVVPLIQEELEPLVEHMQHDFKLKLTYSADNGLSVSLMNEEKTRTVNDEQNEMDSLRTRQRKYLIKITYPDGRVTAHDRVWQTLMEVVEFAGAENVRKLGIRVMRVNLVSPDLLEDERYRVAQKEIQPGLYVCTYSSTEMKLQQIITINSRLHLGLRIEKQQL